MSLLSIILIITFSDNNKNIVTINFNNNSVNNPTTNNSYNINVNIIIMNFEL